MTSIEQVQQYSSGKAFEVEHHEMAATSGKYLPIKPLSTTKSEAESHWQPCDDVVLPTELVDPLVTRGESLIPPEANPKAALIDWLSFTFSFTYDARAFIALNEALVAAFNFGISDSRNKGLQGYSNSWNLGRSYGILATGGQSQANTCLISINGTGCSIIENWLPAYAFLLAHQAKITRVDLAHDDFAGDYNIATGLEMLALNQFTSHGRPPTARFIDDFDSGKGKTLFIGNRRNGRLLRIYEKGKQLGDPLSPWIRWELELRNKGRQLPLDVLLRPGDYLAGGYPCLSWVSTTQERIKTTRKQLKISFDQLKQCCRQSYGKYLHFMHQGLGLEPSEIIQMLSVEGIPTRLDFPIALQEASHDYP